MKTVAARACSRTHHHNYRALLPILTHRSLDFHQRHRPRTTCINSIRTAALLSVGWVGTARRGGRIGDGRRLTVVAAGSRLGGRGVDDDNE